ncbi:MAG: phosphogluconate dehydratase [Legionella sp.]|nr:phosphogluconate dehydratase [Legionella sp.]
MHPLIKQTISRIECRSQESRDRYLDNIEQARFKGPHRGGLPCGNLAHGFAAAQHADKCDLRGLKKANIAIISAYNDVLSAHQPYATFPAQLKTALYEVGCVGQVAAGVPAMCDGVTQGEAGMELSLLSRDVIAMSTAIGLSHNLFDGGLMLGICDKIVPGLLIGALRFGHLPFIFVPAGPMPSGISNLKKAQVRERYAEGLVDRDELLEVEAASYHAPGTCTFYGTANSNQLLIEVMGLHLPGASFVNPQTPLRNALTRAAAHQIASLTHLKDTYLPIGKLLDAKSLVNAMVALLATGGSTNHTLHLVAIARAAGFKLYWDDFATLSEITPLLARIYPNGQADINQFQQAGGMAYLIRTLLEGGLLVDDVETVVGKGLWRYTEQPKLKQQQLQWIEGPSNSSDLNVLRSPDYPFKSHGGLKVLSGNVGYAILKTSALPADRGVIEAPAIVFSSQEALEEAFQSGSLNQDCVVVIRFQGPKACGMPELHRLTPCLSVLQDRGFRVALVTDGRMSGASGKVPAAIHVTPEAFDQGVIAKIQTGDRIRVDSEQGQLKLLVSDEELMKRLPASYDPQIAREGMGRELFGALRAQFSTAMEGACSLFKDFND